jgi:3-oxoacyl-[acyl-carrier protein] reductase
LQEGVFRTLQLVVPHMVPADEGASGWGRIVLVSSNLDEAGLPRSAPYATAKSALRGLALVLKSELGPRGVLVNVVKPGLTTTERTVAGRVPSVFLAPEAKATPTSRLSTPEEVAKVIVFLGSGANGNATGQFVTVDGGKH